MVAPCCSAYLCTSLQCRFRILVWARFESCKLKAGARNIKNHQERNKTKTVFSIDHTTKSLIIRKNNDDEKPRTLREEWTRPSFYHILTSTLMKSKRKTSSKKFISFVLEVYFLCSVATADELFECDWPFYGVGT